MEKQKIIITSYYEPDLDAVSSMYAYTEYLNKKGIPSEYLIYGIPKNEVTIVSDLFGIKLLGRKSIPTDEKVIILDTNSPNEVNFINDKNIIEVIDHHKKVAKDNTFPNAKIQIEQLGAVATIIAEKFKKDNINISDESAILLYYGIISNSLNLQAAITTERDIEMTKWLEKKCQKIDKEKIKTIFIEKSKIEDENLRKEMEAEVVFIHNNETMTVAQLEIANVDKFLLNKQDKIIKILSQIKEEKKIDHIFINCVDILNGYNIILTLDSKTSKILENLFNFSFNKNSCKTNKLIQRKELLKLLKTERI